MVGEKADHHVFGRRRERFACHRNVLRDRHALVNRLAFGSALSGGAIVALLPNDARRRERRGRHEKYASTRGITRAVTSAEIAADNQMVPP